VLWERLVNAAPWQSTARSAATAAGIGTSPCRPGCRGRHFDGGRKVGSLRQDAENGNPFDVRVVESPRTACVEIVDSKTK
jgi:hypothetical protein